MFGVVFDNVVTGLFSTISSSSRGDIANLVDDSAGDANRTLREIEDGSKGERENLHITVRFSATQKQVARAAAVCKSSETEPFVCGALGWDISGAWGPRAVWLGVSEGPSRRGILQRARKTPEVIDIRPYASFHPTCVGTFSGPAHRSDNARFAESCGPNGRVRGIRYCMKSLTRGRVWPARWSRFEV